MEIHGKNRGDEMNAYELAEQAEGLAYEIPADWSSGEPKNVATDIANMLRQQADRIKDLEKLLEHSVGADCREMRYIQEIENKDARIAELEFENKAFRDELFKRGSMDSCSQAAALHGFVSPRQAGDDAREYIANVLKKASEK